MDLITLSAAKAHLRLFDVDHEDDYLAGLITAASAYVEDDMGITYTDIAPPPPITVTNQ